MKRLTANRRIDGPFSDVTVCLLRSRALENSTTTNFKRQVMSSGTFGSLPASVFLNADDVMTLLVHAVFLFAFFLHVSLCLSCILHRLARALHAEEGKKESNHFYHQFSKKNTFGRIPSSFSGEFVRWSCDQTGASVSFETELWRRNLELIACSVFVFRIHDRMKQGISFGIV